MNKRIIFDKDDNYGSFHLEEYYPYKRENHVILDKDDKLINTKSIKIEIDCPIIDKAIEFLQECIPYYFLISKDKSEILNHMS